MKGVLETSAYLLIFAMICLVSIDFIKINKQVSDAGEVSRYVENYIEAYCGESVVEDGTGSRNVYVPDRESLMTQLKEVVSEAGMNLEFGQTERTGNYEYIEYELTYSLRAGMFDYSARHNISGLARYNVA